MDRVALGMVAAWIVVQIPFIVVMGKRRRALRPYPLGLQMSLLIPGARGWETHVRAEDRASIEGYRRVAMFYYWVVFALPLVGLPVPLLVTTLTLD